MFSSFWLTSFLVLALPAQAAIIDLDILGSTTPATPDARSSEPIEVVEVTSTERGHLLALVPLEIPIRVKAYATGEVELSFPWYANLSVMSRGELLTELRAAVSNVLHLEQLASVKAAGSAARPSFTPDEALATRTAIKAVLAEG